MLTVSERAASVLHDALAADEAGEEELFRLTGSGDDLTLLIGGARKDDQLITHERRGVLAIAADIAGAFDGAVLDAMDTPEGPRLILRGPDDV